jgi:polysaccharide pyruvyl transferase WcaK-like protein
LRTGLLLYGYFGAGNLGDDLLLATAVGKLRPIFPGAMFYVRDHGESIDSTAFSDSVTWTGIERILADGPRPRLFRLFLYLGAYVSLFRRCQWLVFAGGTLFHERGTLTSLTLQWMICMLARMQGVRIAALGVGVAELQSFAGRWLLKQIIGMAELFFVRDEAALRQCGPGKARLVEDLVFAISELKQVPRPGRGSPVIGLAVYPPACGGTSGEAVRAALVEAVRRWQARGYTVVFLVCQRGGAVAGDEAVFQQLKAALGASAGLIEMRILAADAAALSRQLGDVHVICGMRFHALVLAAMLGRPFAGIAHDNKISEICRRFDMPWVSIGDLRGLEFAGSVEEVRNRIPDVALIQRSRELAAENFTAFAARAQ